MNPLKSDGGELEPKIEHEDNLRGLEDQISSLQSRIESIKITDEDFAALNRIVRDYSDIVTQLKPLIAKLYGSPTLSKLIVHDCVKPLVIFNYATIWARLTPESQVSKLKKMDNSLKAILAYLKFFLSLFKSPDFSISNLLTQLGIQQQEGMYVQHNKTIEVIGVTHLFDLTSYFITSTLLINALNLESSGQLRIRIEERRDSSDQSFAYLYVEDNIKTSNTIPLEGMHEALFFGYNEEQDTGSLSIGGTKMVAYLIGRQLKRLSPNLTELELDEKFSEYIHILQGNFKGIRIRFDII
jgi:hypothetical protein